MSDCQWSRCLHWKTTLRVQEPTPSPSVPVVTQREHFQIIFITVFGIRLIGCGGRSVGGLVVSLGEPEPSCHEATCGRGRLTWGKGGRQAVLDVRVTTCSHLAQSSIYPGHYRTARGGRKHYHKSKSHTGTLPFQLFVA